MTISMDQISDMRRLVPGVSVHADARALDLEELVADASRRRAHTGAYLAVEEGRLVVWTVDEEEVRVADFERACGAAAFLRGATEQAARALDAFDSGVQAAGGIVDASLVDAGRVEVTAGPCHTVRAGFITPLPPDILPVVDVTEGDEGGDRVLLILYVMGADGEDPILFEARYALSEQIGRAFVGAGMRRTEAGDKRCIEELDEERLPHDGATRGSESSMNPLRGVAR